MARIRALNETYLRARNEQIRLKSLKAGLELAKERGELIARSEFEHRPGLLPDCLSPGTLALKHTYGRRILNISDLRTATEVRSGPRGA